MDKKWKFRFEAWTPLGENLGATIYFRGVEGIDEAKMIAKQLYRKTYPGFEKAVKIYNQSNQLMFNSKRKQKWKSVD